MKPYAVNSIGDANYNTWNKFYADANSYDDIKSCRQKLNNLKIEQEKLSKKINKKVIGMIEKAESEAEELNRKKQVILNDKLKIETVIDELDIKKKLELQTTWVKVNRDFGSIFSTLLPGTMAKLEPIAEPVTTIGDSNPAEPPKPTVSALVTI